MTNSQHPEQDPVEGSREAIERDLQQQEKKAQPNGRTPLNGADPSKSTVPGAETQPD